MPNWIQGNMKIRGKECDVFRFFQNAFAYYDFKKIEDESGKLHYEYVKDETKVKVDIWNDDGEADIDIEDGCHIEGTRRAFCDGGYVYFENINSENEVTKVVNIRQAWGFQDNDYVELSKKYKIDIKLIGWEKGMEYKGELLVLRNEKPIYTETEYDDWDWEAECPTFGG